MKKIFDIITVVLFCTIIFSVPLLTKLEPYSQYSAYENRNLAKVPGFSVDGLLNGSYMPLWDTYLSDHIWKRNYALKLYTLMNARILNKPVVNNVVIQKNLLLPFIEFSNTVYNYDNEAGEMARRLSALNNRVKAYGGKFIYIGVPEQFSMFRSLYPAYLNNNDENLTIKETAFFSGLSQNDIDYVNMRTVFLNEENYPDYYSKIDHHYNIFGAFLTYKTVMNKIKDSTAPSLPVLSDADIRFVPIENPFYGSRSRKIYNVFNFDEKLYYYTMEEPVPFERYDNGQSEEPVVFFLPRDTASPVTYNVYMNGDIGETIINTNRGQLPDALIFGDSFTNPLETFMYTSFNQTVSLDLRHYTEKTILEYIDDYKPDYVFCLRDDTAYLSVDGNGRIE